MISFKTYIVEVNNIATAKIKKDYYLNKSLDHYGKADTHYWAAEMIKTNDFGKDKPIKGAKDLQDQDVNMHKNLERKYLHKAKRAGQALTAAKRIIGEANSPEQAAAKKAKYQSRVDSHNAKSTEHMQGKQDGEFWGDHEQIKYHDHMMHHHDRKSRKLQKIVKVADKLSKGQ